MFFSFNPSANFSIVIPHGQPEGKPSPEEEYYKPWGGASQMWNIYLAVSFLQDVLNIES